MSEGHHVISGEHNIKLFRMITLLSALGLELKGLKTSRGASAYAIIKKEYGLKGSKSAVHMVFKDIVTRAKHERIAAQADIQIQRLGRLS